MVINAPNPASQGRKGGAPVNDSCPDEADTVLEPEDPSPPPVPAVDTAWVEEVVALVG
jgi:hypothetical protein